MRLLPNELLEAIVYWMSPVDALSFGATCKQCNKITYEPLLWRRHCIETWRYWDNHHEIKEKMASPPAQVRWRELYNERSLRDKNATMIFDQLLLSQQYRMQRMETIAAMGYDIKDLMLRMYNDTPENAEDVLALRLRATMTRPCSAT